MVLNKVKEVCAIFDELNTEKERVTARQSIVDMALSDILHFLESDEPLHPTRDFKVIQRLISLRRERQSINVFLREDASFRTQWHRLLNNVTRPSALTTIENRGTIYEYNNRVFDDVRTLTLKDMTNTNKLKKVLDK